MKKKEQILFLCEIFSMNRRPLRSPLARQERPDFWDKFRGNVHERNVLRLERCLDLSILLVFRLILRIQYCRQ